MLSRHDQVAGDLAALTRDQHWRHFDQLRPCAHNEYGELAHLGAPLRSYFLYDSAVICSETSPIRKMMTAALNSSVLMFVKRPAVENV